MKKMLMISILLIYLSVNAYALEVEILDVQFDQNLMLAETIVEMDDGNILLLPITIDTTNGAITISGKPLYESDFFETYDFCDAIALATVLFSALLNYFSFSADLIWIFVPLLLIFALACM